MQACQYQLAASRIYAQALGIAFRSESCAEPNLKFQAFFQLNNFGMIRHSFRTLQCQMRGEGCLLCRPDDSDSCSGISGHVNYGITGTPCPPFSKQRPKRHIDGSVQSHRLFQTTFTDFVEWLAKFEPGASTLEQVVGFDEPESSSDISTPMKRHVGSKKKLGFSDTVCFCA
jgi:hypothetical protein